MAARQLSGIRDLADRFEIFILDQFGVLHDGTAPYPGAVETLVKLKQAGKRTLLLSNSGKRSAPNEARLERLGFVPGSWDFSSPRAKSPGRACESSSSAKRVSAACSSPATATARRSRACR